MKKLCLTCLVLLLILSALPVFAGADYSTSIEADINSKGVYFICTDNDEVIYQKNPDESRQIASLTKLATAAVVFDSVKDMSAKATVSDNAVHSIDGTNSKVLGLIVDEEMSIEELLYGLLVDSANDAANVLAEYVAGSTEAFVDKMNTLAVGLGCENTHFSNVHGLDDAGNYSSPRDLMTIARHCLTYPLFETIVTTRDHTVPPTNLSDEKDITSTNMMFSGVADYKYPYARGGKTGTTSGAGHCLWSFCEKDGYNYMCVALGGDMMDFDDDNVDERMSYIDSKILYNWAFDNLRLRTVADTTDIVTVIDVRLGVEEDHIRLVPAARITALVPKEVTKESVLIEPVREKTASEIEAPVAAGDVLGYATIKYADEVIAEVDLVAADSIKRSLPKFILDRVGRFVLSKTFIAVFSAALMCTVVVVILILRGRKRADRIRIVGKK